jgi:hypothetical protein
VKLKRTSSTTATVEWVIDFVMVFISLKLVTNS